ncbi:hypothetical protein M8J75_004120 [Diaphorina citri]|nr:hypothetical protein M8J75_004120 [Diaphorina citri]
MPDPIVLFLLYCYRVNTQRSQHSARTLTDEEINEITSRIDMAEFNTVLDPILVERGVGSENHEVVKNYIISELKSSGLDVETDTFSDTVPNFGRLTFTNIIGHVNPTAPRALSLACHYDSKIMASPFIGATDSAVPCAMLLYIARLMRQELGQLNQNLGLDLIFFDGEEAFNEWSAEDSIWGARHLAAKWERSHIQHRGKTLTKLDRMDMLVLLDLLGTSNPRFYSYYPPTHKWYKQLVGIESRLTARGLLNMVNSNRSKKLTYFREMSTFPVAEDDHLPFYYRDVNVLHCIPYPFPSVWHKSSDNKSALDMNTIENLLKIFQVFTMEYMWGE